MRAGEGARWVCAFGLLLLCLDPSLSGVSASRVNVNERYMRPFKHLETQPTFTEPLLDHTWELDKAWDDMHASQAISDYGNNTWMQARGDMVPTIIFYISLVVVCIMASSWTSMVFTVPCRLHERLPGMEEILKTHDSSFDEGKLKFGNRMTRFIMQVWNDENDEGPPLVELQPEQVQKSMEETHTKGAHRKQSNAGPHGAKKHRHATATGDEMPDGVVSMLSLMQVNGTRPQVRLYPWTRQMRDAEGQLVLMNHESHRDENFDEYGGSRHGQKWSYVYAKENALILAISMGAGSPKNNKCYPFINDDPRMYTLYNAAHEGGGQFESELDNAISESQASHGASPVSVLFLQEEDGLVWCHHGYDYIYLCPEDSGPNNFKNTPELPEGENIREWVHEFRKRVRERDDVSSHMAYYKHPPPGSLLFEASTNHSMLGIDTFGMNHPLESSKRTLTLLFSVGMLATTLYYTIDDRFVKLKGFLGTPDIADGILGRYTSNYPFDQFDSLMLANLVLPLVFVMVLWGLETPFIKVFKSKEWTQTIVKTLILFGSLILPMVTFVYSSQLGNQYGKAIAQRTVAFGYVAQFLALAFYFNAFINAARSYLGLTLKPLVTDEGETLMFALIGIVEATFGFINDSRAAHAHGGMCRFTDLSQTLADVVKRYPKTKYTFDLQCDVLGGMYVAGPGSWCVHCNATAMSLFDAALAGITKGDHTYDGSHCLLTCTEKGGANRAKTTIAQCRDDGIVGCVWYKTGFTEAVCPASVIS